jgi:hypothetical protein
VTHTYVDHELEGFVDTDKLLEELTGREVKRVAQKPDVDDVKISVWGDRQKMISNLKRLAVETAETIPTRAGSAICFPR